MKLKRLIIKFKDESSLKEFSELVDISLSNLVEYYNLETHEKRVRRKPYTSNAKNVDSRVKSWGLNWDNEIEYVLTPHDFYNIISFDIHPDNIKSFSELINQPLSAKTKSIYYPEVKAGADTNIRVVSDPEGAQNPQYPIYVVSKTRSDNCVTAMYLRDMGIPFYIVIEEHQYMDYAEYFAEEHLLILEQKYLDEYITYDDFGSTKSKGPGAARNFAWNHAKQNGHKWHWVMDDNIFGFLQYNHGNRMYITDGGPLLAMEDYVNRFENVAISGLNYKMFVTPNSVYKPFARNTRIYSCLLIRNDIPYQWQGRYNEDTDISLRVLKDGWCTIQFNAVLCDKLCTQNMKGGNTEEFYAHEGTLPKSKMLEDIHPDVAKVQWKLGRWHHQVDYSSFTQELIEKPDYVTREYNLKEIRISKDDHKAHNNSKKYIYKKYLAKEVNDILSLPDILPHKVPSAEKIQQGKDEKLAREIRDTNKVKDKNKTSAYKSSTIEVQGANDNKVIITGSDACKDKEAAMKIIDEYVKTNNVTELIDGTMNEIDKFVAIYGFDNNVPVKDFAPNDLTEFYIHENHNKMAEYADRAILFLKRTDKYFIRLGELLKKAGKEVKYIFLDDSAEVLEDW